VQTATGDGEGDREIESERERERKRERERESDRVARLATVEDEEREQNGSGGRTGQGRLLLFFFARAGLRGGAGRRSGKESSQTKAGGQTWHGRGCGQRRPGKEGKGEERGLGGVECSASQSPIKGKDTYSSREHKEEPIRQKSFLPRNVAHTALIEGRVTGHSVNHGVECAACVEPMGWL